MDLLWLAMGLALAIPASTALAWGLSMMGQGPHAHGAALGMSLWPPWLPCVSAAWRATHKRLEKGPADSVWGCKQSNWIEACCYASVLLVRFSG